MLQNANFCPYLKEDDDDNDDYEDDGKVFLQGNKETYQMEPIILVLASHISM